MNLYEATRDLHHNAETHPWGSRMAKGDISQTEYWHWLWELWLIHSKLDDFMPLECQRNRSLGWDMAKTDCAKTVINQINSDKHDFAAMSEADRRGWAYILTGAHFRGGAVIRKRMKPKGFSCRHLYFEKPEIVHTYLTDLREKPECADGARAAFAALTEIMDEINT